ncbi:GHKL domain-containing protein [Roseburia hominis]
MSESGFIYQIISAVVQIMSVIVSGICMEGLLTGREDRGGKRKRIAIWSILCSVWVIIKCLFAMPPHYYNVINPILITLSYVFVLTYFYSDKAWIKFTHVSMLIMQSVLADVILYIVFGEVKKLNLRYASFANPYMAERGTMVAALTIFLNIAYMVVVLRLQKKRRHTISPIWLAVMLQMLFVFMMICAIKWSQAGGDDFKLYFSYFCCYTVLEFALVMLYVGQLEKRETQEKVRKLQQEGELKKAHYEQIEVRRQEMAKLRCDYGNILTSILDLLEHGKKDEAETVIQDLSVRISATREYPFCAVPIVNAILTEKQKVCEEEGISQDLNLMIPDMTGIAELDLCMIFGNLMDNAIRACKEVREQGKECAITLNGGIAQEYLIIKCKNTALENHKNKIWGTGYGHKILADIARKYGGDFQTMYEKENFMAQISLKLQN